MEGVDLPADLCGTYFRNGPGKFKVKDRSVAHEFDGDGLIFALSFTEEGKILVRHRLVQTQGLLRDEFKKEMYTVGYYGTQAAAEGLAAMDPRRKVPKNTYNQGICVWEDKVLALNDYGKPFPIEPAILATMLGDQDDGSWNIDGFLDDKIGFEARPKVCGTEECLTNISQTSDALRTVVYFFEFAKDQFRARYKIPRRVLLAGYTRISDFSITPKWLVLARPPLKVDTFKAATGASFQEVCSFDEGGKGELVFTTRLKKDEDEVTVEVENLVCDEFANSFELEDRKVVLDVVVADSWDRGRVADASRSRWEAEDPSQRPRHRLVRYEVDLASKAVTKREICGRHLSFTSVNPEMVGKKHQFVFAAVAHGEDEVGPMGGIAKIDVDSGSLDVWTVKPTEFVSEPMFVSRKESQGEDDGYLITVVFDGAAEKSDVVILDAKDVSRGPVTRFSLRAAIPHGLGRGWWQKGMTFTEDQVKKKMVLLNLFKKKMLEWNDMSLGYSTLGGGLFMKQGVKFR